MSAPIALSAMGVLMAFAGLARAEGLPEKYLTLIPDDTVRILSINMELYARSPFSYLFPASRVEGSGVRYTTLIKPARWGTPSLRLVGVPWPTLPPGFPPDEVKASVYRGIPILTVLDEVSAKLDEATQLRGDPDSVYSALDRWLDAREGPTELAKEAGRLSDSFDNWFLIAKPLQFVRESRDSSGPLPFADELVESVQQISGGVRLGGSSQVKLSAVTATPDDAQAVAAIARRLPGFFQLNGDETWSQLINLVEGFDAWASGTTATLKFFVPDDAVERLLESRAERESLPPVP